MKSRRIYKKLIPFLVIALNLINFIPSFADTIKYIYDDLNRLIRIEDPSGRVTEFEYDEVGNRLSKTSHEAYTITATAGANGSISPSGSVAAPYKGTLTFSITANTGYQLADVLIDGVSVGSVSSYTFSNITTRSLPDSSDRLVDLIEKMDNKLIGCYLGSGTERARHILIASLSDISV